VSKERPAQNRIAIWISIAAAVVAGYALGAREPRMEAQQRSTFEREIIIELRGIRSAVDSIDAAVDSIEACIGETSFRSSACRLQVEVRQ